MLITTTNVLEGYEIVEYKGLVYGEVISGVNFFRDFAAGLRDLVGGRSASYEQELVDAREESIREMSINAEKIGANAVIGVDLDYEVLGKENGMLMATSCGTAVVIRKK